MKLVVGSITPGMMTLPSGSLTSSKTFHSCSWRGLAASKDMACRPGRQYQVDEVGQGDVTVVRALVVAPAHVHAEPVGRDVPGGVVQCLQARTATRVFRLGCSGLSVPLAGQVGTVELQHDAGLVDGVVLLFHGVGESEDVVLGAGVIAVSHKNSMTPGDAADMKTSVGVARGGLQVGDVGLDHRPVGVADRAVATGGGHDGRQL